MKEKIRQHKFLAGVVIGLLALILVVMLGSFWFVWDKLSMLQYVEQVPVEPAAAEEVGEEPAQDIDPLLEQNKKWIDRDVMNVLLLGTDERSDAFSDNARSDSMIVASLNKKTNTVSLVSLERGMGVEVLEGEYKGQEDWLTHMFRYGGANLVMKTVNKNFDLNIDRFVRMNFNAVRHMVDALGGVDIELTAEEALYFWQCSDRDGTGTHGPDDFNDKEAGLHHLNGKWALAYSQLREIDDDWHRVQRQRNVIVQCADKLRNLSLSGINDLANTMLPLVQTNLTKGEIAQLLLMAPKYRTVAIQQMTIPAEGTFVGGKIGMGGRSLLDVDFEANSKIIREFLYSTGE